MTMVFLAAPVRGVRLFRKEKFAIASRVNHANNRHPARINDKTRKITSLVLRKTPLRSARMKDRPGGAIGGIAMDLFLQETGA